MSALQAVIQVLIEPLNISADSGRMISAFGRQSVSKPRITPAMIEFDVFGLWITEISVKMSVTNNAVEREVIRTSPVK